MNHYPQVLIADDDAGVRKILVSIVQNTLPSAKVTAVENGKQGLESFRRHGADLVISNFIMPEMDGPSFVETLRKDGEEVPIIMVSGSSEAEALGKLAGIDSFVKKLEIMTELPRQIRTLMGENRVLCLNRFLHG